MHKRTRKPTPYEVTSIPGQVRIWLLERRQSNVGSGVVNLALQYGTKAFFVRGVQGYAWTHSEGLSMRKLALNRAFTLIEPGPVVLVTTYDGKKNNVMTISWTMVLDFTPMFAFVTGEWNHSFAALRKTKECVIAIPTVDLLDKVVGIGTCSGGDTDKFDEFELNVSPGKHVKAPLIKECLANIECKVVEIISKHNIVVLEGMAAYMNHNRKEKRTLHAVGDGSFIVDGRKLNRKKRMAVKWAGIL